MSCPGRIRIACRRRITDDASTGEMILVEGATITDCAGVMGAVGFSGVEVVVSYFESSEHRKGETICATDTRGSELSDGSASDKNDYQARAPPAKPSTTKETPKGKAPSSKTGKSASAKEPVEESIAEVVMDEAGEDVVRDDDQPQDTSKPKTAKTPNPKWFTQPPRPPTPDPEWNKRQVVLDQPKQPWFNQMVSATKDPLTFKDLMATLIDFSKYVLNRLKIDNLTQDILLGPAYNMLKGMCSSSIELEYHFQECFNALTDKLDWNNPEGDHYPFDLSKPIPLQGHPGYLTVAADYFFNNDL
ncbi:hypothetical protein Tco_0782756 [Tanacetum coccineum]